MKPDIDRTARCEAQGIGAGSRVLPFARVGPEVEIGSGCLVGAHAVLEGPVVLADAVQVLAGARLVGRISVGPGATIRAGAVLSGEEPIEVGRRAVVEAGAVVGENVPANAVVRGNPARIVSYVDGGHVREVVTPAAEADVAETGVGGVTVHQLTRAQDLRGSLAAAEFTDLPFAPRRLFAVYGVPSESVRGAHAHRECSQLLVCLAGAMSCLVDDGSAREEIALSTPDVGLHIPPMIWGTQWKFTRDAILLVLASHPYDPDDYIRDYEQFLAAL